MEEDAGHQVFRAGQTVRFEHRCADAEPHQVQAYARLKSDDGYARTLALVYARRGPAPGYELVIGARLVAIRLEATSAGTKWLVGLEAHTDACRHVGVRHSHYICCPTPGERRRRPFRADSTGVLDWLDYAEPVNGKGSGRYPRNWSPTMETTAAALGIGGESRNVALDLVLTQTDTGNTVRLCGPTFRIPDRIWNERPSEPKIPGLPASLNPFVRSGLWRTLARAARYQECIRERRCAKRLFAAR